VEVRRRALGEAGVLALLAAGLSGCAGGALGERAPGSMPLVFGSQGNVTLMSVDGRTRKALTRVPAGATARDPAWSPDGRRIVYSYAPPLSQARGPGGLMALPTSELRVVNGDGSGDRVLVPGAGPGATFDSPAWAPDGSALYVTYVEITMSSNVVTDGSVEVARLPLQDGPSGPQPAGPRQTIVRDAMSPTISPDGARLACVSTRAGGADGQALLLANADGSNVRQLLPARLDGFNAPRFSPDGKHIAFARISPSLPVPTTTPPPGREAPAPFGSPPARGGAGAGPGGLAALWGRIAPRRVRAHGTPMDIFVCGAEGEDLRRLTELGEDDPSPCWSPDGRRIAFIAEGGVYLMNADGSDLAHVTHEGGHSRMDWKR
jgi:Tol biopolymer transport system component